MSARLTKLDARSRAGTSAAELPMGIMFLFVFMLLPLVDLATIAIRTSMVYTATHNALQAAIRAKTFKADDVDTGAPSAVNVAKGTATANLQNGLSGVEFTPADVQVFIIGTPTNVTVSPLRTSDPVASVREKDYLYQIEVVVNARVQPLIMMNDKLFGNIQGLTAPIAITAQNKGFVERPAGLSK